MNSSVMFIKFLVINIFARVYIFYITIVLIGSYRLFFQLKKILQKHRNRYRYTVNGQNMLFDEVPQRFTVALTG